MKKTDNTTLYEDNIIIVDVRTTDEYDDYHIKGAINLPIFTNEERAHIGTTYKQESTSSAKKLGVKYISYKVEDIVNQLIDYSEKYRKVIVYCQRGGMRSGTIVSLLNAIGQGNIYQLENGIKGHRQYINEVLPDLIEKYEFITLHGHTGVGKTKILKRLDQMACTVLDYEKHAQNAGSVFGNIMYAGKAPTQKQFEEELFYILKSSSSPYAFMESESKRVGRVQIPDAYMKKMETGRHILVETYLEKRIANLLSDYEATDCQDELIECVDKLRKRIGNKQADELIHYINHDNLEALVAYLLTDYYDPLYTYSIDKYDYEKVINYKEIEEVVNYISELLGKEN